MGQNFQTGDVRIERIDDTPAAAVRAELDGKLVEKYAGLLDEGVEFADPAVGFGYPGDGGRLLYLLADGRHRTKACLKVGREVIRCRYEVYDTREEAERRAYEFAVSANETHGKQRSDEDKRAAVTAALLRPEWADKSNREIAELCNVSKHIPNKIRRELTAAGTLTGRAASNHPERKFKINATYGGGRQYDDNGGTKAKAVSPAGSAASVGTASESSPPPSTDSAPDCDDGTAGDATRADEAWRDAPIAHRLDMDAASARTIRLSGINTLGQLHDKFASGEPIGTGISAEAKDYLLEQLARIASPEIDDGLGELPADEPPAAPSNRATAQPEGTPAPAVIVDEKGRPVPVKLLPVFEARKKFRAFSQRVAAMKREVEGWAKEPDGRAICLNPFHVDANNLSKGVAGAMPYVVCPSCDGEGMQGKTVCPTCSNKGDKEGRGWVSRMRYQQLTPELKRVCEGWGQPADAV